MLVMGASLMLPMRAQVTVIPLPNNVVKIDGSLTLNSIVQLINPPDDAGTSQRAITQIFKSIARTDSAHPLRVLFIAAPDIANEGYQMNIDSAGISIAASGAAGRYYALQTLKQMVKFGNGKTFPLVQIHDAPRYSWRGFMIDESRHFFGKKKVLQVLDQMALLKLNRFHWHLTDSNGWRIEIKKYPKLTSIGGRGDRTHPDAPAQYYTQQDVKQIVAYAAARHIVVVPEIDMPGHASAASRAYPEISGGGNAGNPGFTFNPGSEKTYQFLTDVLTEVAQLFPGQWIHFGGDEVHFANKQWLEIPEVKRLMTLHKLENLKQVEYYFNRRMADVITKLGKTTIGWDEVANAGLDPDKTLVMWWRHDKKKLLNKLFESNFKVVLCPRIPCYFDFVQDASHKVGRRWAGDFAPLKKVYQFPAGLTLPDKLVQGIQGNLWSEAVRTGKRFDFMTYPRLHALAEAAWTADKNKNYSTFLQRLRPHMAEMEKAKIYYFDPFAPQHHLEPGE